MLELYKCRQKTSFPFRSPLSSSAFTLNQNATIKETKGLSQHWPPPMQRTTRTAFISRFCSKERRRQSEMGDIGTAHPMHYHLCRFCLEGGLSHSENFHPSRFSLWLTESWNLCLEPTRPKSSFVHGHNRNWYLTRALNYMFVCPGPSFRPRMTVIIALVDFLFRVTSSEFTVNNPERRHAPLKPASIHHWRTSFITSAESLKRASDLAHSRHTHKKKDSTSTQ
jgi:hypothetical protein